MPPRQPAPDDDVYTTAEVCRRLKIAKSSVYRLVADGRLPVLRVRRSMRYPRAGLDAYVASVLVPARAVPPSTTAKECPR